jgi:hypothetical protein
MTEAKVTRSEVLVKLTGTIANYRCTRAEASFFFDDGDRTKLGVIAVAAGIAGLSGQAISTAANASGVEEEADYVEFDLDGQPVKGWVWRSPFRDGDAVEVAAEWQADHYETGAIARPVDRVVALYPHCSRATRRHVENAIKWWLLGVIGWVIFSWLLFVLALGWSSAIALTLDGFQYGAVGSFAFFGLMTISLAHKWMPFVRLTEKVCRTLDFPDPGNVDLVKSSKIQRKLDDPGELGTFYFRY